jgi:hypothetical protein
MAVSHDTNALPAHTSSRTRPHKSEHVHARLDRPSLFAEQDDGVEEIAADRVRLLSPQPTRRGQRIRHARPGTGEPYLRRVLTDTPQLWERTLFAAMALGIVIVLYSFVQVVRQQHKTPSLAAAAPVAVVPASSAGTPPTLPALNDLPPTAAGPRDTSEGPARIETPPSAFPVASATPPANSTPLPISEPVLNDHAKRLVARATADAERLNAPTPTAPVPRPAASLDTPNRARPNDDVALLEAMMRHAASRTAPPSAAEALAGCADLQGAEAAVCKAKACVQHPTAAQCHSDVR